MIKINVVINFPKWKKKIKNINNYFKSKEKKFNNNFNSSKTIKEFTIFLTNNSKMKNLNKKFRKINKSTDVLSFPLNIKLKSNIYADKNLINFKKQYANYINSIDEVKKEVLK